MSDILLKDKDGIEQSYTGIETVEFKTSDGVAEFSEGGGAALSVNWRYYQTKALRSDASTNTDITISVTLPDNAIIKEVWLTAKRNVPILGNPDDYPDTGTGFKLITDYSVEGNQVSAIDKAPVSSSYPAKSYVGLMVVYELDSAKATLNEDGTYNLNFNYSGNRYKWGLPDDEAADGALYPFFRPQQNVLVCELGDKCSELPLSFMSQMISLKEIKFSSAVSAINNYICRLCTNLTTLDFSKSLSVVALSNSSYIPNNETLTIKVPSSLVADWKAAQNWTKFADKIIGV